MVDSPYEAKMTFKVQGYGNDAQVEWCRSWLEAQLTALLATQVHLRVKKVVRDGVVLRLGVVRPTESGEPAADNSRDVGEVTDRLREVGGTVYGDEDHYRQGELGVGYGDPLQ